MFGLLTDGSVIVDMRATSKKQALQELAHKASELTGQKERVIFDTLLERERLGTTGVGRGIAIPHGKLPELNKVHGLFAKLKEPVDFDAIDDQPVDLIFLLLAPSEAGADHLKALARVARLLRNDGLCQKLRGCEHIDGVLALVNETAEAHAA
ncbi:MAG: PTS IIA-like nitrogen regulatory protein PtsN [Pseudomonadota bacterium]